ncbi:MAG: lipopolysaccharide kinase InaA family protein [Phocaeicola sp.]|uniref:lipopolysaccharide kinase InaA family protein n=1 Tax=Phocaeicola sp. TaxID=2773926 RepID=UPI003FA02779
MKVVINPKYECERPFIEQLPIIFEKEGEFIYNQRNQVKRFLINGNERIIKRYKTPGLIQRVIYSTIRKTKARRAFEFANKMSSLGIDTPESIAYIEQKDGLLFSIGYFIAKACYDKDLRNALRDQDIFDKELANQLTTFLVFMHEKGVMHGDLNLSNILYRKEKDHYHFTVIDTNRSIFKKQLTQQECLNNLKRLTHRPDLMDYIIRRYAQLRGWNEEETISIENKFVHRFENKGKWKNYFKKLCP